MFKAISLCRSNTTKMANYAEDGHMVNGRNLATFGMSHA